MNQLLKLHNNRDALGIEEYFRLDINGEWKPFTPIKPPPDLHPNMLYIPSIIACLIYEQEDLLRAYENDRQELEQEFSNYLVGVKNLVSQFNRDYAKIEIELNKITASPSTSQTPPTIAPRPQP